MNTALDVNHWQTLRERLSGLPNGDGVNIAYEAVDRHVAEGFGSTTAMRFLGKRDAPDGAGQEYTYQRLSTES